MAARGKAEALQRLRIELEEDRLGLGEEPHLDREIEIGAIGHLEIALVVGELVAPEAAVLDVALS